MSDRDWSDAELDAIVKDYFDMLSKEQSGQSYVKAEHRRRLRPLLLNRTEGSIEMKHCNISGVLDEMKLEHIDGYKPRKHFQAALHNAVEAYLRKKPLAERPRKRRA